MMKRKAKRFFAAGLAALAVLSFSACDSDSDEALGGVANSSNNSDNSTVENGDLPDNNENKNEESKIETVFEKYPNLIQIGGFKNGLAPFLTSETVGNGLVSAIIYRLGYIDVKGQVIIEPIYKVADQWGTKPVHLPLFENDYIKIDQSDRTAVLIDKQGNVKFQTGVNGVEAIGDISNGYFWVESATEDISGKTYSVRYYNVENLQQVAVFENTCAYYSGSSYSSEVDADGMFGVYANSDWHEISWGNSELHLELNIKDYDPSFSPIAEFVWDISLKDVSNFGTAQSLDYALSENENTLGRIATVKLVNPQNKEYYAVVDQNGNVLMQPQTDILFYGVINRWGTEGFSKAVWFCKDLCPAKDKSTGKWGYISPTGEWKIAPQYTSASNFSTDGYATVNDTTVIDTSGTVILSK